MKFFIENLLYISLLDGSRNILMNQNNLYLKHYSIDKVLKMVYVYHIKSTIGWSIIMMGQCLIQIQQQHRISIHKHLKFQLMEKKRIYFCNIYLYKYEQEMIMKYFLLRLKDTTSNNKNKNDEYLIRNCSNVEGELICFLFC